MSNEVNIDDVNVAECMYAANSIPIDCENDTCFCYENTNCYFKQLQRAKAELEQYKKSKQASYEVMQREWNAAINEYRKIIIENEKLKNALEEIMKSFKDFQISTIPFHIADNKKMPHIMADSIQYYSERIIDKINEVLNEQL